MEGHPQLIIGDIHSNLITNNRILDPVDDDLTGEFLRCERSIIPFVEGCTTDLEGNRVVLTSGNGSRLLDLYSEVLHHYLPSLWFHPLEGDLS